ncbi:MAG: heme ABC exporter ATP-binding protein CcmA [Pseudomonadota bacterium]
MLSIHRLAFQRQSIPILRQVALHLDAGEVVLIRGENGSGKSTLVRLLAGLVPAQDVFEVTLDGEPFSPGDPRCQARFAYLGHTLGLKDVLTCQENLSFYRQFLGAHPEGLSVSGALKACGLDGYQYSPAGRLSAGQRKRLALARLLLRPVDIWLLDEPYSNLDAEGITLVDRLLQQHIDLNGRALLTSHGTFVPQVTRHREVDMREFTQ